MWIPELSDLLPSLGPRQDGGCKGGVASGSRGTMRYSYVMLYFTKTF